MNRFEQATRLWPLLAQAALQRMTLGEHRTGKLLGLPRISLVEVLEIVTSYCVLRGLPPVTTLVVDEHSGMPDGRLVTPTELPRVQAQVFAHDWLAVEVPRVADFERAAAELPSHGRSRLELLLAHSPG